MIVQTETDVRKLVLETSPFGPEDIERLKRTIATPQISEVRQAIFELQRRVEERGGSDRDSLVIGVGLYFLGNHTAADRLLSKIANDGVAAYFHAKALVNLQRYEEADKRFEDAAKLGYDPVKCTLSRAGVVRLMGRLEDAEELLRSTGREGATRGEYSYQMGCILSDRGDTYGAIEYFERAVDMEPHHAGALFRLAGLNNLYGNDSEAIRLYEQSASKPPFYMGALLNLGLLYEDSENYPAAAFCFRRVLESDPLHERARLYLKDIEASSDMYYDEDAVRRQRDLDSVLQTPITDFEISARSRNCLERAGIETLGDLTRSTEQELLAGKNFGETSLTEIREILSSRGLSIGQAVEREQPTQAFYGREDLSPQERALMEAPVTELNLSVRARKCLTRLGITSLGDLVSRSADELLSVRNFGVTSLNEIRTKLIDRGMNLRND